MISLACPHAGQAVDFINLPSCRAGTYFRYAAKVSKGAPKGKGKPFRAVSLFPLETLFPSAETRNASAHECAVSHVCESVKAVPATLTLQNPNCAGITLTLFASVRHRALAARMRSASGRKIEGIPKGGKKTAPNGCLSSLWCAFAYFYRTVKVGACPA